MKKTALNTAIFAIEKHPLDQKGPRVIDLEVRMDYILDISPKP